MSVCRKLPDGTIQKIAGHTILLDANASEIRKGTYNIAAPSTGSEGIHMFQSVTFTDPMPDTDYQVIIEPTSHDAWEQLQVEVQNKTTTGFDICVWMYPGHSTTGVWTAVKFVELEGYTELQNKINNPDETPTIDSMNLVTSDGVARAIENASAVWKGTKAEWNALPATTKIKYDLAVLIDTQLIKSVDRTDGTDSDVADLTNVWTGTQAEWDAMTQAQKDKWDKAMIQDGYYGITPAVLPVGCVQAYMGTVEPPGWLICNGQTFDTEKYPELYNVLGTNKVPDLRGEFLRGAGTNGHSGQGSGGAVGAHQNATEIPHIWKYSRAIYGIGQNGNYSNDFSNVDSYKNYASGIEQSCASATGDIRSASPERYMTRPTNTSVNWIIFAGPAQ